MRKTIKESKGFQSYYENCRKLYKNFNREYLEALELFVIDRSLVYDHELSKRDLKGHRAFAINNDLRVVYLETKNSIIFVRVGSHTEVY